MTDQCIMCHKFIPNYGEEHCAHCIEILTTEMAEAEIGIGTGSVISGKFGDRIFCRHCIDRKYGRPMTHLRLLTEAIAK